MVHFANSTWWYGFIPLFLVGILYKYLRPHVITYSFSFVSKIKHALPLMNIPAYLLYGLRFLSLLFLLIAIGKPQKIDPQSKVSVDGIDIMMVVDASASMLQIFDDPSDKRPRFAIAQKEAISFIEKRTHDQVGLVLFGLYAVLRCPLTLDRTMVKKLIQNIEPGEYGVDFHQGTSLADALLVAARRMQRSQSQSKVIIVLTDGMPTDQQRLPEVLPILKKFGIKLYAIAIGNPEGAYAQTPYGIMPVHEAGVNMQLLEQVTDFVGGKAFSAHNAAELEKIYNTIDELETTEFESYVYQKYYEIGMPFVWTAFGLCMSELVATVWWMVL